MYQLEHLVVSELLEGKTLIWRWRHCRMRDVTSPLASLGLYLASPELSMCTKLFIKLVARHTKVKEMEV